MYIAKMLFWILLTIHFYLQHANRSFTAKILANNFCIQLLCVVRSMRNIMFEMRWSGWMHARTNYGCNESIFSHHFLLPHTSAENDLKSWHRNTLCTFITTVTTKKTIKLSAFKISRNLFLGYFMSITRNKFSVKFCHKSIKSKWRAESEQLKRNR